MNNWSALGLLLLTLSMVYIIHVHNVNLGILYMRPDLILANS